MLTIIARAASAVPTTPWCSMEGEEVQKVRCRTCSYEHKYRHNKTGKKEMTKEEAFQKVLASVTGQLGGASPQPSKKKSK